MNLISSTANFSSPMKVQQIISYRFLDCLIKRDNEGRLQTKVYRKKTHTGQYLHYTSNQPEHVKIGTIKTLVRRAKIACSTEESLSDEFDYIKKTMRLNGYPEKLITKTIIVI